MWLFLIELFCRIIDLWKFKLMYMLQRSISLYQYFLNCWPELEFMRTFCCAGMVCFSRLIHLHCFMDIFLILWIVTLTYFLQLLILKVSTKILFFKFIWTNQEFETPSRESLFFLIFVLILIVFHLICEGQVTLDKSQ